MGLIVQKYGGTSVADPERIKQVAERILATKRQGHDVVVVVSAMSGETNRLVALAEHFSKTPIAREFDVLLATGEQVTISLLAMALISKGQDARSYTGSQVHILTNSSHNKARILDIDSQPIKEDLAAGRVVVVAGFQGVDEYRNITTLGRGGSDTTAVALAAALDADECQIYTDVDGVYTTDPRVVPEARRMDKITYEEMLEMASLGAKVLQIRSVQFASKYHIPLRVLSSFTDINAKPQGTLITTEDNILEQALISGIAFNEDEAKLTVFGVPDKPGIAYHILGDVADANIEVDMIVQNVSEDKGHTDFTFTVHRNDFEQTKTIVENCAKQLNAKGVVGDNNIVKISLVGVGMRSHAGIASQMFRVLADQGVNIKMISTSEIKISVIVDEQYLKKSVQALHKAFDLAQDKKTD